MNAAAADVAVWEEILYRLERDLDHSETSLHVAPNPFTPPAEVPPLPQELLGRAREVLDRQKRLEETLVAALHHNLDQRRAGAALTGSMHQPAAPAYLDTHA